MDLADLGEFGLIERLSKKMTTFHPQTKLGIGDDAAVIEIDPKSEQLLLFSTDMLLEGVHFDLSYVSLKHLGYKAMVVNISDIAAMNGIAKQATFSIAVSNRFSVEAIEELYKGVRSACKNYKVDLVGGDTTSSRNGLFTSVSILGIVDKKRIAYRNKAEVNDIICVTGDLGAAYLGLLLLEREKKIFLENDTIQPDFTGKDYLLERQLKPEARTDIVYELQELDIVPTSMIDISDGLASEILHLTSKSNTGAVLFEENIPVHDLAKFTAQEFAISPVTAALNGGEDYELLFTIKPTDFEKIKVIDQISVIGFMTEAAQGVSLRSREGEFVPIKAQGWKHF